jgi:branched-chain amino acid transport system substrate-binding protein
LAAIMRRFAPVLVITAALAVLASSASASSQSAAATKPPIKVFLNVAMNVISHPFGELNIPAAKAAIDAINKKGGINGQQIEMAFCNNQNTATASADCGRQAVAFGADIQYYTGANNAWQPITKAAGIPTIGEPSNPSVLKDSLFWALAVPSSISLTAIVWHLAKTLKCKKLAYTTPDIGAAYNIWALIKIAAKRAGIREARLFTVSLTAVDMLPAAQQIKTYGPDCQASALGKVQSISLLNALSQLGLGGIPTGVGASVGSDNGDYPNSAEGFIMRGSVPGVRAAPLTTDPAAKQYFAETRAAGMSDADTQQTQAVIGWRAMHAIAALGPTLKGKTINRASLTKALRTAKGLKVPMIGVWSPSTKGPAAYPQAPLDATYLYTVKGGKWTSLTPKAPINVWTILGLK